MLKMRSGHGPLTLCVKGSEHLHQAQSRHGGAGQAVLRKTVQDRPSKIAAPEMKRGHSCECPLSSQRKNHNFSPRCASAMRYQERPSSGNSPIKRHCIPGWILVNGAIPLFTVLILPGYSGLSPDENVEKK
jgi:hypothetical protein